MSCREAPNAAVWYGPVDVGLTCNWRKVTAHFVSVCNCTLCWALLAVRFEVKESCVWGDDVSPSVTYFQRLNPSCRFHEIWYRSSL